MQADDLPSRASQRRCRSSSTGELISLTLRAVDHTATLEVANAAPPLSESLVAGLFDFLKRGWVANERNPNGLGLSLYIASEMVKGHGGMLTYRYEADRVVFGVLRISAHRGRGFSLMVDGISA